MNEQNTIQPNFNHRLNCKAKADLDRLDLINGIELIADRASGVVELMQTYLNIDSEGGGTSSVEPEILYYALESVRNDLNDLKAIGKSLMVGGAA